VITTCSASGRTGSLAARKRTGMWRAGQSTESAFTLLEVLIVLTVLSLVGTAMALGLPNVRDRIRVVQAAAWLDSMLADLRGQARRESRSTWIDFDATAGRYRLREGEWRALPPGVTWAVETGRDSIAEARTVVFLPDGTGSGMTMTIRAGAYSSVHQVEWLTGAIQHARR